jgi:3-(3-hydroxy-phenyl)propionate hydroxylase
VVQVLESSTSPQSVEHVFDQQGHLRQAAHAQETAWALLRPDAYLAATGTHGPSWRREVVDAVNQALSLHTL